MQEENQQLAGLNVWSTLADFYAANTSRRNSSEYDFPGINERWTDRCGWRWIVYFMSATWEIVAQRVDYYDPDGPGVPEREERGPVVVLGTVPCELTDDWSPVDLADLLVGDIYALTKNRDFIPILVDRIQSGARILKAIFRDKDSPVGGDR